MPPSISTPDSVKLPSGSTEPRSGAAPASESITGRAIIVGAGPAGLTAAIELLRHSGVKPMVIEASHEIGGISRTVRYKGNRMDIGGHRFFSKSDRVMQWWLEMMPVEARRRRADGHLRYQGKRRDVPEPDAVPRSRTGRPGDAGAPAQEPHLLSAPVFRLPDQHDRGHIQELGPRAHHALRLQLPAHGRHASSAKRRRSRTSSSTALAASST